MNKDAESLATRMLDAVRGYVARAVSAVDARLDEFEARIKAIPAGPKGDRGEAGKDFDPVATEDAIRRAVAAIPAPKNGSDGRDGAPGKSAYALAVERGFTGTELQWLDSIKGERGPVGEKGERGESIQGPRGEKGEPGNDGKSIQGEKGETGGVGLRGEPGKDGAPGRDAVVDYDRIESAIKEVVPVAVKEEVTKAVAALPVPKDGKDAPAVDEAAIVERVRAQIPAPKDGLNGKDGESIHPDTVSLMVRDAVAAEVQKIPQAKDGKDGAAGRDALEFNPLPSIDESKSYPGGTWARYCGGLIKAVRKTDPITESLADAGWEVMVEGLSAIVVTQGDNLRSFTVGAMLTSGAKAVSDFSLPVLLDRGVYRSGAPYEKGDVVTYGGAQWVCTKNTKAKPPSDDWRLQVARGRDGKDSQ